MDTRLRDCILELHGAEVVEGRVPPKRIVEALHEVEDVSAYGISSRIVFAGRAFGLEGGPVTRCRSPEQLAGTLKAQYPDGSAMRVSQDKVLVEVDELEPTPQTKKATLKLDDKGRLSVAP